MDVNSYIIAVSKNLRMCNVMRNQTSLNFYAVLMIVVARPEENLDSRNKSDFTHLGKVYLLRAFALSLPLRSFAMLNDN